MASTALLFPDEPDEPINSEPSAERTRAHAWHDPTEVAQVMAQRIRDSFATPEQAARDLRRLIAYRLAVPTVALRRLGHLDLLFQMVMAKPNDLLAYDAYAAEVKVRRARGEEYVSAETLSQHYGGWDGVLGVAERFRDIGGAARTKYSHKPARVRQQSYHPVEIRRAIISCRKHIGDWPTEYEFERWCGLKREANHKARLPGLIPIRKAYGSYADALRITREGYECGPGGEEDLDAPAAA